MPASVPFTLAACLQPRTAGAPTLLLDYPTCFGSCHALRILLPLCLTRRPRWHWTPSCARHLLVPGSSGLEQDTYI